MFDFHASTQLWAVGAVISLKTAGGTTVIQIPTFYLNPNVQGITGERGAKRVATEIINPTNDPAVAEGLSVSVALVSKPAGDP
jgi:hypothetical protein